MHNDKDQEAYTNPNVAYSVCVKSTQKIIINAIDTTCILKLNAYLGRNNLIVLVTQNLIGSFNFSEVLYIQ